MTWYVASCILAIVVKSGHQKIFPVFEEFFLVTAEDRVAARREAESFGRQAELDDTLTYEDRPATKMFLGIRKIRSVYNAHPLDIDVDQPSHGTELTHSYYELQSLDEAKRLGEGKAVYLEYVDDDAE
jgi:hypothetical protein